jgi:hypothetical protein
MAAIISLEEFKKLKKNAKIRDINDNMWTVVMDCYLDSGKHPACLFYHPLTTELSFLFHDGTYIRYEDEENKEIDGAICGELDR